jgi:uncharacterized membrane protein YebE (DUF533 family)
MTGGAALGLLGVAMEAVEHFMNRNQAGAATGASAKTTGGTPPPMSMPGVSRSGGPPPPPPSTGGACTTPLPPPAGSKAVSESRNDDAVLLIRAMIAAANADGIIDAQERAQVLDKLKTVSLSEDDRQFIMHELLEPKDIDTIIGGVSSDEMGRQVYMVSLAAIEVDTDVERSYLRQLAEKLRLQPQQVEDIHRQMGVPVDLV